MNKMNAIEANRYGSASVFQYNKVDRPEPKPNEVLIRIYASTVTASDIMMRRGFPLVGRLYLGITRPKKAILGFDFAGEIVAVGSDVDFYKIGDKVFGGSTSLGCYAEYVCINYKDVLTTLPDNLSYEDAAPIGGSAITVMNFLKGQANIKKGHKVLIYGASGGLGTYAIQIAKHFGAEVTGVCSGANVEMVKSLGADFVIDYTIEDFTKRGIEYDVIFDTVGKSSFSHCKKSLRTDGIYLSAVFGFGLLVQSIVCLIVGNKRVKLSATGLLSLQQRFNYLIELRSLLKAGLLKTVVDQYFPLKNMIDAHTYVEKGHKKGHVVVRM